jgi:ribonuclease-3
MAIDFSQFEQKIDIHFKDKELLKKAFTHRSFLNEHRAVVAEHNERLEFLGDAVLELIVTEYLFAKYPEKPEGELTAYRSALVNANTLAAVAEKIEINEFLLLSKGEAKDTGRARSYILANAIEAIIGAIFLDQGYDAAKKFVMANVLVLIDEIIAKGSFIDSKSLFQELAQEHTGITPAYRIIKQEGPDHNKLFTVGVYIGAELVVEGVGKSKQEAEQRAAEQALALKQWAIEKN